MIKSETDQANLDHSPAQAFESFSEDPHLSGHITAAYINGLQDNGIGACPKHLVCNDSEDERMSCSSEVGDRALREIYLAPFQIAQRLAQPWSIMTGYNRLNGVYCELCAGVRVWSELLTDAVSLRRLRGQGAAAGYRQG